MTDLELDGMLRRILLDVLRNEEADREEADCVFIPSKNHLRQMKMMLRDPLKWMRNRSKPLWKAIVQKVAVALLIASLGLGSVMVVSPTARAAVIRWILELYETHITYRFFGEDISGQMPQYGIADLPEGYVETDRTVHSATVSVLYEDGIGGIVCLDYAYMQQGTVVVLTPKNGDDVLPITIGRFAGQALLPLKPTSSKTITWINTTENIQFMVNGFGELEDILRLAESVSLIDVIEKK